MSPGRVAVIAIVLAVVGVGTWLSLGGAARSPEAGRRKLPIPPTTMAGPVPGASVVPYADLTAEARAAIYKEVLEGEVRARRDATAVHPDPASSDDNPLATGSGAARVIRKREALVETLKTKYSNQIAYRHGLSAEHMAQIIREGRAKAPPSTQP